MNSNIRHKIKRAARGTGKLIIDSEWFGLGFVLAVFSMITVVLPFPISDSGEFTFYLSEFAIMTGMVLAAAAFKKKEYAPSGMITALFYAMTAFCAWYAVVCVARYFMGYEVKQSLLALRSTILPLFALLMIDLKWERGLKCLLGLNVFNTVICIAQFCYGWYSVRMSPFMGNIMVFTCSVTTLIPINFYVLHMVNQGKCGRFFKYTAMFNILCTMFFAFMSGARSSILAGGLGLFVSLIIFFKQKKVFRQSMLTIICSVILILAMWLFNIGGRAVEGIYRVMPTPAQVVAVIDPELAKSLPGGSEYVSPFGESAMTIVAHTEEIKEERERSDVTRMALWQKSFESFLKDPIIGEGVMYFAFDNNYGVEQQAAHNFILEHINAYGLIGFLLWSAMIIIPMWVVVISKKYGGIRKNTLPKLCMVCSVGMVLIQSLAQPTMLIVTTVTLMWLTIGGWHGIISDLDEAKGQ